MKSIHLCFIPILMIAFIIMGCEKKKNAAKPEVTIVNTTSAASNPQAAQSDSQQATTAKPAALPKLLDLGAKKCIPCKMMAPILDELTIEYAGQFDVEFVDVWQPENKEIAIKHQIKSIPTQIFFNPEGERLWYHEGFISKDDILKKWEELGYTFTAPQPVTVDVQ